MTEQNEIRWKVKYIEYLTKCHTVNFTSVLKNKLPGEIHVVSGVLE